MTTEIEITYPVLRCSAEEDVFYQRLFEIPGVLEVTTLGRKISVSISDRCSVEALKEVAEVCNMWHTTYKMMPA